MIMVLTVTVTTLCSKMKTTQIVYIQHSLKLYVFVWKHTRIQGSTPFYLCGQQFRYHGKQIEILNKFAFQWCLEDWIKVYCLNMHVLHIISVRVNYKVTTLLFSYFHSSLHRKDVFFSVSDQNQLTPNNGSLFYLQGWLIIWYHYLLLIKMHYPGQ